MRTSNPLMSTQPDAPESLGGLASEILESLDFGVAVFDTELRLLKANAQYIELCGYDENLCSPGTSLDALIRASLQSRGLEPDEIDTSISTTMLRLKVGGVHKFRFQTAEGRYIAVTRSRNVDGLLTESVLELRGADTADDGAEQLLNMAEIARSRMSYALDAMADGFALYDQHDKLVLYNQNYVQLNPDIADLIKPGASYESMLRKNVERGGVELHEMEPDAYVDWRMQQHLDPQKAYTNQLADGRWVRMQDTRTDDGGIVCIRADITELRTQEFENERIAGDLDMASERLNEAMNNMVQGLCMFDADRNLILCNRQYLEMYGFSAEIVKPGIAMADVMRYSISLGNYRDEDAQKALATRNDTKNLSERTVIKQYLRDGRVIAVLNEPMSNGGTIATYEDITKLETHEAKLIAYTNKLERSNRELQDFAYVASHDLQEPLRKIEAFSDRLMQKYSDRLPEDGQMYVERMQNAAQRMRQLINDLLGYSRVTTKAKPFVRVNLAETAEGVLSDLQVRIQEIDATIEVADMPTIDADATQMRQLIQNLLSNALKFCKPDVAPVVKISCEPFTHFTENGLPIDFIRLTLADNGIGFDNQYKDQIFAIFQRLHGRMEFEGTGIGLATCRKIIERHQGTIDANGVPGEGATFTIELPVAQKNSEED